MLHKKLMLCFVFLLGLGITGMQAQKMYVQEAAGTNTAYLLADISKIEVASASLVITKKDGNSDLFPLNTLGYINFSTSTGIGKLAKPSKGMDLQVYPNPVIDLLNVKLSGTVNKSGIIEILSIEGKSVIKQQINNRDNVYQIDMSHLSKGLYLCRYNNGTVIETVKFLKH